MSDVKYRSSKRVKNFINHISISLSKLAEEMLYVTPQETVNPKTIESVKAQLYSWKEGKQLPGIERMEGAVMVFQKREVASTEIEQLKEDIAFDRIGGDGLTQSVLNIKRSPEEKKGLIKYMPEFNYEDVSEQRKRSENDPEMYCDVVLTPVLTHPNEWLDNRTDKSRLTGTIIIAGTMGTSENEYIKNKAHELLHGMRNAFENSPRVDTLEDYDLIRTYFDIMAQIEGTTEHNKQCVEFIGHHCDDNRILIFIQRQGVGR